MSTYRALPLGDHLAPDAVKERMLALDPRWGELPYWQAIAKNASRWTPDYLLTSVDLHRKPEGGIERVDPDQRVFFSILLRTFEISAVVTVWCLLLGYPLAYWLSTLTARQANVLMILVLVPFWTSILVRVAAWIVLLQREGLVNSALMGIGAIALLHNVEVLNIEATWRLWPAIFLFTGLIKLVNKGFFSVNAHIQLALGTILLAGFNGYAPEAERYWPLGLVWVGTVLLVRALLPKPQPEPLPEAQPLPHDGDTRLP